ncbi:MAG: YbaB/EbfC family nucleoid-associated protein [Puniceicoccales bacterium]|jgi:DNA-binding YbaB/EbfC family protein|nr:YbaB/EbfC family nucleoid-associated protein [Puniceicoccales bacterium]
MAGVGKILKQAQKMQKRIEEAQAKLAETPIEVSYGGGAVKVTANGQNEITGLVLDPEFLKEDKALIEQSILGALKEANAKVSALRQSSMSFATEGFNLAGF